MSIRLASRGAATTRMTGTIRDSIRHTLEGRLGYRFQSEALLVQALTHRSHGRQHNERLEFLGDSVLNCAVASLLYARFADSPEGALSRLRANLVKQDPLHDIACGLSLPDALILGEGERKSGGHRRPSILADAVEALLGAIFLESGFAAAAGVVERLYQPRPCLPQVAWADKKRTENDRFDPSSVCRSDHSCSASASARVGESDRYCPIF